MINKIPQFALIIGSMKSGTTYLFSLLAQHPEISACNIKEPEFFIRDYPNHKDITSYYNLWDFNLKQHKVALEASTSYTKLPRFPNAAEIIKSSGINTKFIYMMRHPVERIRSQIQMSRCFDWKVFDDEGNIHKDTIAISKYHFQISEYLKRFSSDKILLLSFEEFTKDPNAIIKKVCEFLEIDTSFKFSLEEGGKHTSTIYLYQNTFVTNKLYGISSYEEYINYITRNKYTVKNKFLIWYLTKKSKLKSSQKKLIKQELKEDIEKLKLDFGFDISLWKF